MNFDFQGLVKADRMHGRFKIKYKRIQWISHLLPFTDMSWRGRPEKTSLRIICERPCHEYRMICRPIGLFV